MKTSGSSVTNLWDLEVSYNGALPLLNSLSNFSWIEQRTMKWYPNIKGIVVKNSVYHEVKIPNMKVAIESTVKRQ